jgi:tRNA/rRNA methyltransferase
MSFLTYILRCADGTYYVGHTDNIDKRWAQHQLGELGGYISERRPLEFMWAEEMPTREEALPAGLRIKKWSRAKKEALIVQDWDRRSHFAKPPKDRRSVSASLDRAPRLRSGRTVEGFGGLSSVHPELVEGQVRAKPRTLTTQKPVIVLVRPQLGENIGKAARAMLNFGLTELRLVEPRDGWPNPAAGPAASGADVVLERARVFATTADAVADCSHVYATTVRKRGVTKPVLDPEAAAREIHAQRGRSAILFGPERSGLETTDVALARAILTVPINPEFGSLNLAQAVILVAYEWSKSEALVQPTEEELLPPAPQKELEALIAHFTRLLTPKGYFLPASRAEATQTTLRTMLTKPGWNHLEVRTLRGVLSALERTEERLPR